jgi:lanthanide-dependent methanol dehydrogenase
MQDLPFYTAGGSELLVFKLGGANGQDNSHAPPR